MFCRTKNGTILPTDSCSAALGQSVGSRKKNLWRNTMTIATGTVVTARASESTRWINLMFCIICMVMIANLQYGWTLFVNPINKAHGWSIASIQVAFAVFIALETWLTPIEGWIVDMLGPSRGPKIVVSIGGVLVAIGWVLNAYAESLSMLYLGAVVSGVGGGAIYATSVGMAVKWFPDRRGLAVGLTAAGYGAGAAITVIPIRYVIDTYSYQSAFLWFGLIQGGVVFVLAWFLRGPEPGEMADIPAPKIAQSSRSYNPKEVLSSPVFWLLYVLFVMVSASGLMATAFGLGAAAYWSLGTLGTAPWAFVLFAALIFFTWGEIFSLFPSTCTDTFGTKFATVNLSLLYTAKGTSAFLVPVANMIKVSTGSWHMVFLLTAIMNILVVALALFVLKPMRARMMAQD